MEKRLVFTSKQKVSLENFNPGKVDVGEVAVKSYYSIMSTGTETTVFNRLFEHGSHWDDWAKYPFYPGYAIVGEVKTVGPNVQSVKVGDRVAIRRGHSSFNILPEFDCFIIPKNVNLKHAVWFALAKIAFIGARAAKYTIGDSVLIIGAGPIGQMSIRWAYALGVETIIVSDLAKKRLKFAQKGGAHYFIDRPLEECIDDIKSYTKGALPNIVIDSTGNADVFINVLKIVRNRGRVVILGDTGYPTKQHLTSDVISRGITIIGAHDSHEDNEWIAERIYQLFFNLIGSNRFNLEGLNTHYFQPEECEEAYKIASESRANTMGILFDWTKE